jgi:hypothetical protein
MASVDVVMATTGRLVGLFEAQTAEELIDILCETLPPNCECTLLRGLEVLEPSEPLQHGETLSMIVEPYYKVALVIKHRGKAWAVTSPLVPDFASDVSTREVVVEYHRTEGIEDASKTLQTLFRTLVPEVAWEVGQATHRGIEESLELVGDATLVLVLAENPGPPVFLFIARSNEDLIALGVDNPLQTGDVDDTFSPQGRHNFDMWVTELYAHVPQRNWICALRHFFQQP